MNYEDILEAMIASGIEQPSASIMDDTIRAMDRADIDPYLMAMTFIHAAGTVVNKTLPHEELLHIGKFMRKMGDIKIRAAQTKDMINTNGSNQNYTSRD